MKQTTLTGATVREVGSAYILVKHILKLNEPARDDDMLLVKMVEAYCLSNRFRMPAYETITRCRRKIQNSEGRYLPTEETKLRRTEKQKEFSEIFGD